MREVKIKQVLEDSKTRWWVEVEPDKAHSCMVNLHAHPRAITAVKAIAGSVSYAP